MATPQTINPIGGEGLIPVNDILDRIAAILGTTKMNLYALMHPTIAATSNHLYPTGAGSAGTPLTIRNSSGTGVTQASQRNYQLPSGVVVIDTALGGVISNGSDNATDSFGNGTVDGPFSIGMFVKVKEAIGTKRSLCAKYDSAGTAREFDFYFDTSGILQLDLYDESVDTTEITANAGTAITPYKWAFVCATYDGTETAPVVKIYLDGVLQNDGATTETGAYVAMEDTATPLTWMGAGVAATPLRVFAGEFALPFITGKELSASEVQQIFAYGQLLLGLA